MTGLNAPRTQTKNQPTKAANAKALLIRHPLLPVIATKLEAKPVALTLVATKNPTKSIIPTMRLNNLPKPRPKITIRTMKKVSIIWKRQWS
jgi:hypothetical protein